MESVGDRETRIEVRIRVNTPFGEGVMPSEPKSGANCPKSLNIFSRVVKKRRHTLSKLVFKEPPNLETCSQNHFEAKSFLRSFIFDDHEKFKASIESLPLSAASMQLAKLFLKKRILPSKFSRQVAELLAEPCPQQFKRRAASLQLLVRFQRSTNCSRAVFPFVIDFLKLKERVPPHVRLPDHDFLTKRNYPIILAQLGVKAAFARAVCDPELKTFLHALGVRNFESNFNVWMDKLLFNAEADIRVGVWPRDFESAIKGFQKLLREEICFLEKDRQASVRTSMPEAASIWYDKTFNESHLTKSLSGSLF